MSEVHEEIEYHKISEHSLRRSIEYGRSIHMLHIPVIFDNNKLFKKNNRSCSNNPLVYSPTLNVDIQVNVKKNEAIKPMKKNEYLIFNIILQISSPITASAINI